MNGVRQGFHAARIPGLDWALWDTVGTIAGVELALYWDYLPGFTRSQAYLLAMAIAVVAHIYSNVDTEFLKQLRRLYV